MRRFIEADDTSGLQRATVGKLRKIVTFLQDMGREVELLSVPSWKAHRLSGDSKGCWSLFVAKSWRLNFSVKEAEVEIIDLDYEDYHLETRQWRARKIFA